VGFLYVNGIKTFIYFFFFLKIRQELAPDENIYPKKFCTFFLGIFYIVFSSQLIQNVSKK